MAPRLVRLASYKAPSNDCQVLPASKQGLIKAPLHEEELYITSDRRTVVWRPLSGGHVHTQQDASGAAPVYKQWRFDAPVLQALWVRFDGDDAHARAHMGLCLCVLRDPELLVVYTEHGETHEVALPCQARRVWPLGDRGLLIQRAQVAWEQQGCEESTMAYPGGGALMSEEDMEEGVLDEIPSLFTLTHPLDELKPVALQGAGVTSYVDDADLVCDPLDDVLHTQPVPSPLPVQGVLVVTYKDQTHRLWLAAPTPDTPPDTHAHTHHDGEGLLEDSMDADATVALAELPTTTGTSIFGSVGLHGLNTTTDGRVSMGDMLADALGLSTPTSSAPHTQRESLLATHKRPRALDDLEGEEDEADHPIRPEMWLRLLWTGPATDTHPCARVMTTHEPHTHAHAHTHTDNSSDVLLSLQVETDDGEGMLRVLRLSCLSDDSSTLQVTHAHDIAPCASAASVCVTQAGNPDLLVLERQSLRLYRGLTPVLEMQHPDRHTPVCAETRTHTRTHHTHRGASVCGVVGMRDAVEDRVTLVYDDGSMCRVSLGLSFEHDDPLTATVLSALDATLPYEVSLCLRGDVSTAADAISDPHLQPKLSMDQRSEASVRLHWCALVSVLHHLLHTHAYTQVHAEPPVVPRPPSPWEALLTTPYHHQYANQGSAFLSCLDRSTQQGPPPPTWPLFPPALRTDRSCLHTHLRTVAHTLHLVFQDLTLNTLRWSELEPLGRVLVVLCDVLGPTASAAAATYRRYLGLTEATRAGIHPFLSLGDLPPTVDQEDEASSIWSSPWIDTWVCDRIASGATDSDATAPTDTHLHTGVSSTRAHAHAHTGVSSTHTHTVAPPHAHTHVWGGASSDRHAPWSPVSSHYTLWRELEQGGACRRLGQVVRFFRVCCTEGPVGLVSAMVQEGFRLEDVRTLPLGVSLPLLQALHECRTSNTVPVGWPSEAFTLIGREDLAALHTHTETTGAHARVQPSAAFNVSEGSGHAAASAAGKDRPDTDGAQGEGDVEGLKLVEEQATLRFGKDHRMHEACRLVRTSRPQFLKVERPAELSDHDYLQKQQARLLLLCKRALATPVARGMITLASLPSLMAEPLPIPKMTLAGRVPPTNSTLNLDTSAFSLDMQVWPEFHNGVAAGLRLAPVAGSVTRTWILYNRPRVPTHAHAGLLLALGLQGHLRSLYVTDVYEYLTQGHEPTTVAVFLGMAASRRGSADTTISKMLCLHIPSLIPFAEVEVPPVARSAAVLGIGLLYQGTAHRLMTEFLLGEIGRKPVADRIQDRESYALCAGLALGMVALGRGRDRGMSGIADLHIEDRLHRFVVGGKSSDVQAGASAWNIYTHATSESGSSRVGRLAQENSKCCRIFEGDYINTSVTSPGATLALGLIHLKSNNAAVAARLALPDTHYALDSVRSDMLTLRVLARSLIMWDQVQPNQFWVLAQVPRFIVASCASLSRPASEDAPDVDRQSVRQAHAHILAGACLSLGIRFASTENKDAVQTIMQTIRHLRHLRESVCDVRAPERPVVETCLATTALALGLVMAGSGDLTCFRVLRELRWRFDAEVTYGHHMALHMAIGFLFLGGGRAALKRDDASVAALVASLFPCFPMHTSDNYYVPQALRQLYVLAVEHRGVEAVDVETGLPVYMPLQVNLKDGSSKRVVAPCILPELHTVRCIDIATPRYYPMTFRFPEHEHLFHGWRRRVLVKRKPGHLSYVQDPQALRSLLVRPFSAGPSSGAHDLISAFTEDPHLLAFARHFCDTRTEGCGEDTGLPASYCAGVLYECLTNDKPEMLGPHLWVFQAVTALPSAAPVVAASTVRNLRLILAYYERMSRLRLKLSRSDAPPLLQEDLVQSVRVRLDELLRNMFSTKDGHTAAAAARLQHEYLLCPDAPLPIAPQPPQQRTPVNDGTSIGSSDVAQRRSGSGGGSWTVGDLPALRAAMPHASIATIMASLRLSGEGSPAHGM